MPLTSARRVARFRSPRAQNHSEYTLSSPSDCPTNQDHLKRTANGLPVHSFRTLLGDLATITRNRVVPQVPGAVPFEVLTWPTTLQREAFKLLGVRP